MVFGLGVGALSSLLEAHRLEVSINKLKWGKAILLVTLLVCEGFQTCLICGSTGPLMHIAKRMHQLEAWHRKVFGKRAITDPIKRAQNHHFVETEMIVIHYVYILLSIKST